MKKIGYLTFAALLAFGSCTNEINEEGFVDKANTISFNAYSNKTRAYENGDVDITKMKEGSFGVVGYTSDNNLYLGTTGKAVAQYFSSETSHWEYSNPSDLKFWPNGAMDFYAYFPYAESGDVFASTNSSNGPVMTINNATGNQDVLFASAINQSYEERVPLTFHHAFSKINSVKIKVELANVEVEVKNVEFINTTSSANSKIFVDNNGNASYENLTGSSCSSELTSAETISTSSNTEGYTVWDKDANKYLLATNGTVTNNVVGTSKDMWDGEKASLNGGNLSSKELVCLKITGKVKYNGAFYVGNTTDDGYFYIPLKGPDHTSVSTGLQTDLDYFLAGKRYNYTIIMKNNVGFHDDGTPILKPILFNVNSVDSWNDVNVTIDL